MQKLTIVSGNKHKIAEYERMLGVELESVELDLPEIQSTEVEEVIKLKAEEAYRQLGRPCFVDDTGITIKCWGNLPGALAKHFLVNVGPDGILKLLGDNPRAAYTKVAIGYRDENGLQIFSAMVEGEITTEIRGENGFGFDVIFVPNGCTKTLAEMTVVEKDKVSHRGRAVREMKKGLGL